MTGHGQHGDGAILTWTRHTNSMTSPPADADRSTSLRLVTLTMSKGLSTSFLFSFFLPLVVTLRIMLFFLVAFFFITSIRSVLISLKQAQEPGAQNPQQSQPGLSSVVILGHSKQQRCPPQHRGRSRFTQQSQQKDVQPVHVCGKGIATCRRAMSGPAELIAGAEALHGSCRTLFKLTMADDRCWGPSQFGS